MPPTARQTVERYTNRYMPSTTSFVAILMALASLPAQNLGDHYVDGVRGRDLPTGGTPAAPWKTITYALAQIPPVLDPTRWRTLFVEGAQEYSPVTNGEVLPITPAYNVWIEGRTQGHGRMPVIRAGSGGTALRFDPTVVYSRNRSTLRSLAFEGGEYGVVLGQSGGNRHRPRLERCAFAGQTRAGVRIDDAGPGIGIDPRLFQCVFTAARFGIEINAANPGAVVFPDVEECTFRGLRDAGIRLNDTTAGGHVGGTFRSNWFNTSARGIWIDAHTQATATDCRIVSSSFQDLDDEAVMVIVNGPAATDSRVERCSFLRCETGVRVGGNPAGGRNDLTLSESVAYACSVGLRVNLRGPGTCTLVTRDNLFELCAGAGASFDIAGTDTQFQVHSLRDRFLRNAAGLILGRGSGPGAVRLESGMVCGNTGIGVLALWPFEAHGLTLADNGYGVLASNQGNTATLDHCVFAANATDVAGTPTITYSCFQGSAYPGIGNLARTDPLLVRPFYKLAPQSPCIDRGNAGASLPATDYEGDARASASHHGGSLLPDLGADEYVGSGSARRYGTPGFGPFNLFPAIASPDVRVVRGAPLTITLSGAIQPVHGVPATAAFLTLGGRDDAGALPFDLGAIGAPGSLLWNDVQAVVSLVPVDAWGAASVTCPLPDSPLLVGKTFTWQWFAHLPTANWSAPVASDGLRVTVGQ